MDKLVGIMENVHELPEALAPLREEILANLVLLGQIPAPTGEEEERVRYMLDRFAECGLPEVGPDEAGNAVGLLPGKTGERTLMVVAHLDTIIPRSEDHNVLVQADRIVGPGIADNAMGAAVVSMLPTCLTALGIELESNLALLGTVQSLDRGNHTGLRFHLNHCQRPIQMGICVEGIPLGRLNHFSIGTLRGDITCNVRPVISRSYGSQSAIVVLNHIINRLLKIETPQRPFTHISIGKVHAGMAYDVEPENAELGFEVISHDDEMIDRIEQQIVDIVHEVGSRHAVDAKIDCFFRRSGGGIPFSHPLVKGVVEVMSSLGIEPDQGHSPSELSVFISHEIPAVTLGVTTGKKSSKKHDYVEIEPILRGVAQLIGVILAADGGLCDEP